MFRSSVLGKVTLLADESGLRRGGVGIARAASHGRESQTAQRSLRIHVFMVDRETATLPLLDPAKGALESLRW